MLGDVITIYHFVTNLENTGNVTKVFVGSAILEVDELAKNYILGGGDIASDAFGQLNFYTPRQLQVVPATVVDTIADNDEVNFVSRIEMDDIEWSM